MSKARTIKPAVVAPSVFELAYNVAIARRAEHGAKEEMSQRVSALALFIKGELGESPTKEAQELMRGKVWQGVVSADVFGNVAPASLSKALAILETNLNELKEAQPDAHAARANARKIWERVLKKAGYASTHGNAGNDNSGKGAAPADAPADAPTKLPAIKNDVMTGAAYMALVADTIAALISRGKAQDVINDVPAVLFAKLVDAQKTAAKQIEK